MCTIRGGVLVVPLSVKIAFRENDDPRIESLMKGRFRHFVNMAGRPLDQNEIDGDEKPEQRMDRRPVEREKTATKRYKIKRCCSAGQDFLFFSHSRGVDEAKTTRTNIK